LERDRWSFLAVRAYTRGLLKFTADERSDDRWRLKESIILSEVERDAVVQLNTMVHTAESAAAQYVSSDVFRHHHDKAVKVYGKVRHLLQPYAHKSTGANAASLRDMWIKAFGDPNGEAVQKTIELLRRDNVSE